MSNMFAGAFPILPGKKDRVKNFAQEVAPHQEEWDRLSHEGTFSRYCVFLQETPMGDTAIYAMDIEDPTKARTSFGDSPHDQWWKEYFKDVHGIDFDEIPPEAAVPPPMVYEWKA